LRLMFPGLVLLAGILILPAWKVTAQAQATLVPASTTSEFPAELVDFIPYAKNPIFTGEGPGHWDVKIRERGWILRSGDQWHLWFTGYDGTREGIKLLGHATSADGLTWKRDARNPILSEHWIEDMMVVRHEATYYMFCEGVGDRAQWLTSADGLEWQLRGKLDVRCADGRPLSSGPFGTPTVFIKDGAWYLFYERMDRGVWLAQSKDLKVWTNVQDEPVLSPGPEPYDRLAIAMNQVIEHEGRYYACYHGTGDETAPRQWCSCLAVSDDLRHWRKYEQNPLLTDNQSSNLLIHDGQNYRLYAMHDTVRVYLPKPRSE
jgi:beta-1,2-mannobiose phosphorylase / 1,2-beta-oligomannan phosphorylase